MNARAAPPWSVALLLWLAFLLGPVRFSARDNIPAQLLTESLLSGQGFDLSRFHPSALTSDFKEVFWQGERLVTRFPVVHALLSLPLALVVRALEPEVEPVERSRITGRVAGAFFTAAALGVTYAVLLRLTGPISSLAITLGAAFASPLYSVASRELWNHGPAALLLAAIVWLSLRTTSAALVGGAACVAATYFVRHAALAPAAVLFLVLQWRALRDQPRRGLALAALGGVAASLPLALLNQAAMGNPMGGYAALQAFEYRWGFPKTEALLAYAVSPARGMLLFVPVTLLALGGLRFAARRPHARLAWACLAAVVTALIEIASYGPWWGGWAFGPRMMTEYVPLLGVMAAFCPARAIALGCALCAPVVAIHAAYVFKGGHSWDERRQVDDNPAAVWDVSDSPFTDLVFGPPRPDAATLDAGRVAMPVGTHAISSERPTPWLVYGWEPTENAGVWASGSETWLAVSLPAPGRYALVLQATAPVVRGRPQRLGISISGNAVERRHAFETGLWDDEPVRMEIPYRSGTIVIRIEPDHIWFPGHGAVRRCTFFLRSLGLERLVR